MPRICFNLNKDKVVTSSRMKEFQCNQFITKSHILFARGLVSLRVQHWSAAVVSIGLQNVFSSRIQQHLQEMHQPW